MARPAAGKQPLAHEATHEVSGRGAIDARCLDQPDLIRALALAHDDEHGQLARREASIRECRREGFVRRLLRSVQQVQYAAIQIESVRLCLVHGAHSPINCQSRHFYDP